MCIRHFVYQCIKTSNTEVWCLLCEMMWFEPCLPPHAYLSSGLSGPSLSILPFLFLAFDFLFSACLKEQMGFLPLHTAPSYLMSPLLAQGPTMSADRNSHIIRIIVPTLLPPQSSRVQWAGCVAWGHVGAAVSIPRALGGSSQDPCLPSFTGQTGNISSPGFSFMWLNNTIYVKAIVSLAHLFPFSFQL